MSQPRFLADHDLNENVVTGVLRREPAVTFLRVRDVGMQEAPDDEVLEYAEREMLLIVSHDVNTMPAAAYSRLARGLSFPGLVMVPQSLSVRNVIDGLLLIWSASELEEWREQVVFLPLE